MGKKSKKSKALGRVPQNRYEPEGIDMTKPLDLTKFGSEDDPCFGKLYDLNMKQCKICADADFCAVKMSQNQNISRERLNSENEFIEEFDMKRMEPNNLHKNTMKKIKRFMKRKIDKGIKPILIRKSAIKKYGISKTEAKEIYKSIK